MEQPLDRLKKILDLLGPGLWLELDQAAFPTFFDGDLGKKPAEASAKKFANCMDAPLLSTRNPRGSAAPMRNQHYD